MIPTSVQRCFRSFSPHLSIKNQRDRSIPFEVYITQHCVRIIHTAVSSTVTFFWPCSIAVNWGFLCQFFFYLFFHVDYSLSVLFERLPFWILTSNFHQKKVLYGRNSKYDFRVMEFGIETFFWYLLFLAGRRKFREQIRAVRYLSITWWQLMTVSDGQQHYFVRTGSLTILIIAHSRYVNRNTKRCFLRLLYFWVRPQKVAWSWEQKGHGGQTGFFSKGI